MTDLATTDLATEVLELGRSRGLDAVGIAPARPLTRARRALDERKAAGLHDGMEFTYRNPARSTDPDRAVPGARAVFVAAKRYLIDEPPRPSGPAARVARYAWVDHYAPLRSALWDVAHHLRRAGFKAVAYADDNTVVDREVAYEAGLGWFGKNANLLLPGAGSWFVLGSVLTSAPLVAAPLGNAAQPAVVADGCGPCRRCIDACPTGAIVGAGVIDARRCLAWLLQKPGMIPLEYRVAVGDRIYGCDDCQDACPFNRRAHSEPERADAVAWVPVLDLLAADDAQLIERHGRWYLHNREARWLRRNALVVLGNVADGGDGAVVAALERYLGHQDSMLRAHATWAARRMGRGDIVRADDPDPLVRAELAAPVPIRPPAPGVGSAR